MQQQSVVKKANKPVVVASCRYSRLGLGLLPRLVQSRGAVLHVSAFDRLYVNTGAYQRHYGDYSY